MNIVVTIGPASWGPEVVSGLLECGVHRFRFPMSKELPEVHLENIRRLRGIAASCGREVEVIADLPGGKPRLSNTEPIELQEREYAITAASQAEGKLFLDPSLDLDALRPGARITIGDGENTFVVSSNQAHTLTGHFVRGGVLERRRAFLPTGLGSGIGCLTENDERLVRVARLARAETLAFSFIASGEDVERVRGCVPIADGWAPRIVAKIETLDGVTRAREIAQSADEVMIARGDLALQVGFERLYSCQKAIATACRLEGTPFIVATGVCEGFGAGRDLSRAEAIDVGVARDMGADSVMLSGETTIGPRPIEVVQALATLIRGGQA